MLLLHQDNNIPLNVLMNGNIVVIKRDKHLGIIIGDICQHDILTNATQLMIFPPYGINAI